MIVNTKFMLDQTTSLIFVCSLFDSKCRVNALPDFKSRRPSASRTALQRAHGGSGALCAPTDGTTMHLGSSPPNIAPLGALQNCAGISLRQIGAGCEKMQLKRLARSRSALLRRSNCAVRKIGAKRHIGAPRSTFV
jgi:hypothetical protein